MPYREIEEAPQQESSLASLGKGIGRTIAGGGAKFIDTLQGLLSHLSVGAPTEQSRRHNQPQISDKLLNYINLTRKDVEPQNRIEKFGQELASVVPYALTAGSPSAIASSLGRSAAGLGVKQGLEEVGAPEWLQTAGQIGTETALGLRQVKKSGKVAPSLEKHRENLYTRAKNALGEKEAGSYKKLESAFNRADNVRKIETDAKVINAVEQIHKTIDSNINPSNKTADIRNLWENRKALYQQRQSAAQGVKPYIDEFTKGINAVLKDHDAKNPIFWKNLSAADKITTYQNMNSTIQDYIDKLKNKPSFFKKISPIYAGKRGVAEILKQGENVYRILENPEVRRYYGNLVNATVRNNAPEFLRYADKLKAAWNKSGYEDNSLPNGWREVSEELPAGWKEVTD